MGRYEPNRSLHRSDSPSSDLRLLARAGSVSEAPRDLLVALTTVPKCLPEIHAALGPLKWESHQGRRVVTWRPHNGSFVGGVLDGIAFDRWTRLLAGRPSRRQVVRGFTATLLGGIAVAGITKEAAVACIEAGSDNPCNRDNDCCGDHVRCRHNRCACESGPRMCREGGKDQCFERQDPNHCGSCGKRGKSGQTCKSGRCRGRSSTCTVTGLCGIDRPACCAGFTCSAGRPEAGFGGCVPV